MKFWPFSRNKDGGKSHSPTPSLTHSLTPSLPPPPTSGSFRAFDAALFERTLSNWRWDGGFTNTEILNALPVIRSRSRDMAKNSGEQINTIIYKNTSRTFDRRPNVY